MGHGTDQHVRKPTLVEGLRGKKIVHIAVGALHCLAVSDTGQVCSTNVNKMFQSGRMNVEFPDKPFAFMLCYRYMHGVTMTMDSRAMVQPL